MLTLPFTSGAAQLPRNCCRLTAAPSCTGCPPPTAAQPRRRQQLAATCTAQGRMGAIEYTGTGKQGDASFGAVPAAAPVKWWDGRR